MLLCLCDHKSWMTHKRRENVSMHLQSLQFVAHIQNVTREDQGQEKLRWRKCKLKSDFISPPQKSKILCIKKKSSFVLASISKKCKLKFDKKNSSLVQNISTGISSGILNSSYHALSRADGCVYTETWPRSLGIAASVLGSNPFLVTILGSQKCSLYTWAYSFWVSGRKRHYKECFQSTITQLVLASSISCRVTSLKVFHAKQREA